LLSKTHGSSSYCGGWSSRSVSTHSEPRAYGGRVLAHGNDGEAGREPVDKSRRHLQLLGAAHVHRGKERQILVIVLPEEIERMKQDARLNSRHPAQSECGLEICHGESVRILTQIEQVAEMDRSFEERHRRHWDFQQPIVKLSPDIGPERSESFGESAE